MFSSKLANYRICNTSPVFHEKWIILIYLVVIGLK